MAVHLTRCFNKCCITSAVDETDDDTFQNDSKEDGNVRNECEADETLTVKMGTDW